MGVPTCRDCALRLHGRLASRPYKSGGGGEMGEGFLSVGRFKLPSTRGQAASGDSAAHKKQKKTTTGLSPV